MFNIFGLPFSFPEVASLQSIADSRSGLSFSEAVLNGEVFYGIVFALGLLLNDIKFVKVKLEKR